MRETSKEIGKARLSSSPLSKVKKKGRKRGLNLPKL